MKKTLLIVLTIAMLLSLCACGDSGTLTGEEAEKAIEELQQQEQELIEQLEGFAGMPNPMTEHESLAEINELTGGKLCHPPVMGTSDEKFFTIDCGDHTIAQYMFSLNGVPYTFRFCSSTTDDISGIYTADGTAFGKGSNGEDIEYRITDEYMASRWFNIDGQYVFIADDASAVDESVFRSASEELFMVTFPGLIGTELEAYYDSLAGEYADSWSQRAVARVESYGDSITIGVSWGSSAFEHNEWIMTAKRAEDGLLCYTDCEAYTVTTDAEGNSSIVPYDFPAEGFFSESDGVLYWNGCGDEYCANCAFEKYE